MGIYIVGLDLLKTMLQMLQDELDQGSKLIDSKLMEAIVRSQKDIIKEYVDAIVHYQAWHQFVTEDCKEELA